VKLRRVVFVCTGNICRSAMAEAMAAATHGGDGVVFESAGVRAMAGWSATRSAEAVCAEIGVDAGGHRARQFTREMAESADRIYVMTADHLDSVVAIAPEAADRTAMLRPDGADIADPYGLPTSVYRACRDEIFAALAARGGKL
jgi:protein-tyrosine-phosphatase